MQPDATGEKGEVTLSGGQWGDSSSPETTRASRDNVAYWLPRVRPRQFVDAGGKRRETPELYARIKWQHREAWFCLGTSNRQAAAAKARRIYQALRSKGWDEVLIEEKGRKPTEAERVTLGDYMVALKTVAPIKAETLETYFVKLRRVVAAVAKVPTPPSRYARMGGHAEAWRQRVEAVRLATITTERVQAWVTTRLAEAATNGPVARRRAETTVNSQLRAAAGLFRPKLARLCGVPLPTPAPFSEVIRPKVARARFRAPVDTAELVAKARRDLAGEGEPVVDLVKREAWFAMMLALGAGLRRGEIDALQWDAVDLTAGEIWVLTTADAEAKTRNSEQSIPIGDDLRAMLSAKRKSARGRFVIEGLDEMPKASRCKIYRCDEVFAVLLVWLRENGMAGDAVRSPLHTLRKLFGSEVARRAGIFAASRMLRHADITLTRDYYADGSMVRQALDLGAWLGGVKAAK